MIAQQPFTTTLVSESCRRIVSLCGMCVLLLLAGSRVHADEEPDPVLSLTISCPQRSLKVGDEILVEFTITNDGDTEYRYSDRTYDRSGRMPEYELLATDEQDKPVPDPRGKHPGGRMGGLSTEATLPPDASFTKTITLNRWARITAPGRYRVTGVYQVCWLVENGIVTSNPITITVEPRTEHEMSAHINDLFSELRASKDESERKQTVRKLMYTCRPEIAPGLVDSWYAPEDTFWHSEAFLYYLPRSDKTKNAILKTVQERGLARGMVYVLTQLECMPDSMYSIIKRSLAPDNPKCWSEGAVAAREFPDDRHTTRLIAIATAPDSHARFHAIYALAFNRTDESVRMLRTLLEHPDRSVRETVANVIRAAYLHRSNSKGRPLREEDFDETFRSPERR